MGIFLGIVFGKRFLCTKVDLLSFISDAGILGFINAVIRYGLTYDMVTRTVGWILMLVCFYFANIVRQRFFQGGS